MTRGSSRKEMEKREENNRRIAEKLFGWRFENYYNGGGFWHRNGCEQRQRNSTCACNGQHYLPDFYTDEAANALVLEKMRQPQLDYCLPDSNDENAPPVWRCLSDWEHRDSCACGVDEDRKTAIVNAALKLIESEAK